MDASLQAHLDTLLSWKKAGVHADVLGGEVSEVEGKAITTTFLHWFRILGIVEVPTARRWPARARDFVKQHLIERTPLEGVVELVDGQLCPIDMVICVQVSEYVERSGVMSRPRVFRGAGENALTK